MLHFRQLNRITLAFYSPHSIALHVFTTLFSGHDHVIVLRQSHCSRDHSCMHLHPLLPTRGYLRIAPLPRNDWGTCPTRLRGPVVTVPHLSTPLRFSWMGQQHAPSSHPSHPRDVSRTTYTCLGPACCQPLLPTESSRGHVSDLPRTGPPYRGSYRTDTSSRSSPLTGPSENGLSRLFGVNSSAPYPTCRICSRTRVSRVPRNDPNSCPVRGTPPPIRGQPRTLLDGHGNFGGNERDRLVVSANYFA